MKHARPKWRWRFALSMVLGLFLAAPVAAQQMHQDGFELPWFRTRAEQLARQACEDNLPECRDSIRQQLAIEKTISEMFPWITLCIVVWIVLRLLRRRDRMREQRREEAARHHVRASLRPKEQPAARSDADDDAFADDGLGVGTPGDKSRMRRR